MERLALNVRLRLKRADLLLACFLALALSYALGHGLDWRLRGGAAQAPEGLLEAAPALAPAGPELASAAPVPAWSPDPQEEAWEEMTRELARLSAGYRGRVAVFLKDLRTNRVWAQHPDALFPSASLIKVPVMAGVFARIRDGDLALSGRLTLRRRHRVGGSGSLKWRPDGTKLTVRELLQLMISESDNTATAVLLEAAGIGHLQRQFPRLGLVSTGICPEGMSIRGRPVAQENYTTAREMTMLMEKIYRGELVDASSSRLMLAILKHRKAISSRLAKGLPAGWGIAHKTGLLRRACHDSAIIFTPRGDYALTVLTGENRSYKTAKAFISRLGRVTFRHYQGEARYLAKLSRRTHQVVIR